MYFNFAGISGEMNEKVEEGWDWITDSLCQCNTNFRHEDSELGNFNYTYVIEEIENPEEEGYYIVVALVILKDSICESVRQEIMKTCGENCCEVMDIVCKGLGVQMACEEATEENKEQVIKSAMCAVLPIDGMRGFYLDEAWNKIGSTGWDVLKYCLGKSDSIFGDKMPWQKRSEV